MWARLLLYVSGPIVVKVLAMLGLGFVSYVGFDVALNLIFTEIQRNFGQIPADVMQLLYLSGLPAGMGIILSALFARIALVQVSKIQRIV
jgi:hypothetical protein